MSRAGPEGFRWTRWRRASQLAFVVFFLALPLSHRFLGQHVVLGTLASLQLGPVSLVDPASGLSTLLAARAASLSLIGGMLLPLLLALALGPVFCSWVCPWGLVSESLDRLLRRRVRKIPRWLGKLRGSSLTAFLLASFVFGVPLVSLLSAPRAITALPLELLFLGSAGATTLTVIGGLLLLELVLPRRLWCRALCPVGSVLTLVRSPRTMTVHWTRDACKSNACGVVCFTRCPLNLDPRRMAAGDGCTRCGACVETCPADPVRALNLGIDGLGDRAGGAPPLPGNTGRRRSTG